MDLRDLTLDELKDMIMEKYNEKKYRAIQIFEWLYEKNIDDIDKMTNIPKLLREKLKKDFEFYEIKEIYTEKSKLDSTTKFLFELKDKERIESVILYENNRTTLCISTQIGCKCGCKFCATGKIGFIRNLTPSEIMGQILFAERFLNKRVDNIVFMGMGEPFLNWENVEKTLSILENGYKFSLKRITISTVGIIPLIKEITDKKYKFNLAISLIAPDNELRDKLIPYNKIYPLEKLINVSKYYTQNAKKTITFEYILFNNINDSEEYAKRLLKLVRGINCKINLIPYNYIKNKEFFPPKKNKIIKFQKILIKNGIKTFLRKEKGDDIKAACGQLSAKY